MKRLLALLLLTVATVTAHAQSNVTVTRDMIANQQKGSSNWTFPSYCPKDYRQPCRVNLSIGWAPVSPGTISLQFYTQDKKGETVSTASGYRVSKVRDSALSGYLPFEYVTPEGRTQPCFSLNECKDSAIRRWEEDLEVDLVPFPKDIQ